MQNKKWLGPIRWIKFKCWFIFDLPYFIKEQNLKNGLELGAKAGRSMYHILRVNRNLSLTGIDLWEVIEGSAYKNNDINEEKCRRKLNSFPNRVTLTKGDALQIVSNFENGGFDFIFYDLACKHMADRHPELITKCLSKLKKGGFLIGRDFRNFRGSFYQLGFEEKDFHRCTIGNRTSERLEYLIITTSSLPERGL